MLFSQFRYFFNFYFLLLACSQFVPEMRLGALYTYWVPLVSTLVSNLWTEGSLFPWPGLLGLSSGLLRNMLLLSQYTGCSAFNLQVKVSSGSHWQSPVRSAGHSFSCQLHHPPFQQGLPTCLLWCGSRFELQGKDKLSVLRDGGVF